MSYADKLSEKMCYCMTVKGLHDLMESMCNEGYADSRVTFRVGGCVDGSCTDDPSNKSCYAVCFPIADVRIDTKDPKKKLVMLTPAPRMYEVDGISLPDFDCTVSFCEDHITVQIIDLPKVDHFPEDD